MRIAIAMDTNSIIITIIITIIIIAGQTEIITGTDRTALHIVMQVWLFLSIKSTPVIILTATRKPLLRTMVTISVNAFPTPSNLLSQLRKDRRP